MWALVDQVLSVQMFSRKELFKRRIFIKWSVNHRPSAIFFLHIIFSCIPPLLCSARDTITSNSLLIDGETLVSAGERFELGFFSPNESYMRRYIGIWYYKSNPRIFVWVANRDKPFPDYNGVLKIADDGKLKLLHKNGTPYWYTDAESSSPLYRVAKLMDSGNLVLSDKQVRTSLWESFKHPTDTFLAGMKMGENVSLTSWTSQDNPKAGDFTFKIDRGVNQYQILKGRIRYWRSVESEELYGPIAVMPYEISYLLSNFSQIVKPPDKNSIYSNLTTNMSTIEYSRSRLVMNFTGEIQYWSEDKVNGWSLIWSEPRDPCGNFGSSNKSDVPECKCLTGFVPKSTKNWSSGDFSGGCKRKFALCGVPESQRSFLSLKKKKVNKSDSQIQVTNETECLIECRTTCLCQAYSYEKNISSGRGSDDHSIGGTCLIWTSDLQLLQDEYTNGGRDLYLRVATSNIGSTKRNCGTCGIELIPYPLSTGPGCGDPKYFSFLCDETGQLSFKSPSGTYNVTRIYPDTRNFSIQINDLDSGGRNPEGIFLPIQSSPFHLIGFSSFDVAVEVEIGWEPPGEPTCTTARDCEDWPLSTCNLTGNGERKCLCKEKFEWNRIALNCTQESGLTQKYKAFNGRKKQWILIVGAIIASVIILSCTIISIYSRRKTVKNRENKTTIRPSMAVRFYDSESHVKDMVHLGQFKEEDKKGIDLPFIDFESILAATDNFSETNKLGKGGFGPVYKGKFPGGQEIAVKRLSSVSGQGLEEFKNEVVLIARLQHRNLVRLLGYCVEGAEKILLYEYMPNKSLDFFIFDRTLTVLLDWEMRFNIILGIGRGLLYLHQDSRLRIIHRDLKTSNILLDQEMNPKISDFGLARIFEGKQTEGSTNRVVGTYGYMSPEYALDGFFSVKSDVFSFGVVVLEIISGKRNTGFYNAEEALSLLGYAWRLWQKDKALDIIDQKLRACSKTNEILRCINVGLLCVQEDPIDRPTMSDVVIMLGSESATLPTPRRPAFILRRMPSSTASSSSKPETNIELTVTVEGR